MSNRYLEGEKILIAISKRKKLEKVFLKEKKIFFYQEIGNLFYLTKNFSERKSK